MPQAHGTRSQFLPLRLPSGADLRRALEEAAAKQVNQAAFVVSGIGSLTSAKLRYANAETATEIEGPLEILSLSGSLGDAGAHLHMAVADAEGRVHGGHVAYGCTVRTTAEVLLALLPDWSLTREYDPATGYQELVVRPRGGKPKS